MTKVLRSCTPRYYVRNFLNNIDDKPHFDGFVSEEAKDLLRGLLTQDPNKRLGSKKGVQEVIEHPWFASVDWESLN
jgi:serine/threonine protein kinase